VGFREYSAMEINSAKAEAKEQAGGEKCLVRGFVICIRSHLLG
jgi:hypothetical protein